MKNKDVEGFLKFESEYSLFDRSYNNFPYWQSIRFFIAESCLTNRKDLYEDGLSKSIFKLICKGIVSLIISVKDYFCYLFCSNRDLLVFKSESLKDHFFDCWSIPKTVSNYTIRLEEYSLKYNFFEHFVEWPRIRDNLNKISHRFFKIKNCDKKENIFLKDLQLKLLDRFGQAPSYEYMLKKIHDGMSKDKYYSAYYEKLLNRLKPKAILCIVYYNPKLFPLYKIAKDRGITIIELQHGVVNNHTQYSFIDLSGKNNCMPDYLLTFGDIHSEWVNLPSQEIPFSVGFPYQESMVNKMRNVITDDKKIIIYPESDSRFESVINDFVNKISKLGYKVMVKVHPRQVNYFEQDFPLLSKNKCIEVIKSQSEGIYYWLKIAKHHVMASTTVGLEAMAFDHCNICIAVNIPHDQTQCLLDWGVANGFSSSAELFNLVTSPPKDSKESYIMRDKLWKRNSRYNIESFFEVLSKNNWKYPIK